MTAALAVVRLDIWTVRPYVRQFAFLLVIAAAVGLVMDDPLAVLPMSVVFAVLVASGPFAVAERNDLDALYSVLPVRRSTLVVGRYLFAMVTFVASALASSAVAVVLAVGSGTVPEAGEAGLVLAAVFAMFGVVTAVQYPIYVRLGYTKARLVANLPLVVLAVVGLFAMPQVDTASLPGAAVVVPSVIGVTVAILLASALVAVRLDTRRSGDDPKRSL